MREQIDREYIKGKYQGDLTLIEGTIGQVFCDNKDQVDKAFYDPSVSTEEMLELILYLISTSKDSENRKIITEFTADARRGKQKLLTHFYDFVLASM